MITYDFVVSKKRFERRIKSDIQHKLRVALNCYTVVDFQINDDKTFTFKKKHRQWSTKIVFISKNKDGTPKLYSGKYEFEEVDNSEIKVTIFIDNE